MYHKKYKINHDIITYQQYSCMYHIHANFQDSIPDKWKHFQQQCERKK
jgi:hypothetical protein